MANPAPEVSGSLPANLPTATPGTIDPTRTTYSVNIGGASLEPALTALQWEEQPGQLAQRATITCPNQTLPEGPLQQLAALAAPVLIMADWGQGPTEVLRGRVWDWLFTDEGQETLQLICYDDLMYLQGSEDDRFYIEGQFPGDVLQDIAQAWGFDLAGTSSLPLLPLPRLLYQGQKVASMIQDVLTQTYYFGGGSFLLRATQGQIAVLPPGTNSPVYQLSGADTVNYSDQQSMTDLVTEVNLRGYEADAGAGFQPGGPVRPPFDQTIEGATQYGRLSAIVRAPDPGFGPLTALGMAEQLLIDRGQPSRTQKFQAPDLPFLRRGDLIAVSVATVQGQFWINAITHDAQTRTMQIELDTSGNLATNANGKVRWALGLVGGPGVLLPPY